MSRSPFTRRRVDSSFRQSLARSRSWRVLLSMSQNSHNKSLPEEYSYLERPKETIPIVLATLKSEKFESEARQFTKEGISQFNLTLVFIIKKYETRKIGSLYSGRGLLLVPLFHIALVRTFRRRKSGYRNICWTLGSFDPCVRTLWNDNA